jgi:hypothetical protein
VHFGTHCNDGRCSFSYDCHEFVFKYVACAFLMKDKKVVFRNMFETCLSSISVSLSQKDLLVLQNCFVDYVLLYACI